MTVGRWQEAVFAALWLASASAAAQVAAPDTPAADTIVVTATRTAQSLLDVPAAISVQSLDELRRQGFTFGTDEFRGVPGVFFRRGEGDGDFFPFVSVRGSTGTDGFLALIDGVPFQGIFEEPLLADVPYGALDRAEVVRGPLSALYGRGALYGAVNYLTPSPRSDAVSAALSGGSDGFVRGQGSVSRRLDDRGGVLLSGQYEHFEGWRANSRREVWQLFAKAELDLDDRTTATLFGQYIDRFYELPNGIPLDRQGQLVSVIGGRRGFLGFGRPFEDSQGGFAALKLEHRASDQLTFNLTGQYRRYVRPDARLNFYDPFGFIPARNVSGFNGFRNRTAQQVLFGEATARLKAGGHDLIAGVSYEDTRSREFNRWSGQNGFTPRCGFTFYLVEVDYTTAAVVNRDNPCFEVDTPLLQSRVDQQFLGVFVRTPGRSPTA